MVDEVVFKWSGKEFAVAVKPEETVASLKRKIEVETLVQPKKQKLLGLKLKSGKLAQDDTLVTDLALKPGQKVMLLGSPEVVHEEAAKQAEVAPHIQDDLDVDELQLQEVDVADREENQEKLRRRVASVKVDVLNPPRAGKKCLVLDIDYTLFDLGSTAERPEELARPYLHEFLTVAYHDYDILIWSATGMKWVEVKMRELGCLGHPQYKLTCLLDHRAMITVQTERYGVFDCKPLGFIWAKFPDHYHAGNTIMLDDLRRNYVMNKQNGLVIRPFRKAHTNRATDKELYYLSRYLTKISLLDNLSGLKHKDWRRYLEQEPTVWGGAPNDQELVDFLRLPPRPPPPPGP